MGVGVDFAADIVECGVMVSVGTDVLVAYPMNEWGYIAPEMEEYSRESKCQMTIDVGFVDWF